ncbi:DUF222 domain-containing protein [Cryobacterium sp. TMT2-18-3]|uniref:DUF222 domain-containing protein n=1 Tax=unclassified Cryobacterium TaxID=2649013 RepID=UPI00106B0B96|nr:MULTISPECIES: DUF222 domain-containing protein [unclassified Cryobacterium]TFC30944.1 DUF222 domain-containing protein [Cryobacterium sp. TMT2-18-2]TFC63347.1 DUF222 domain-containing protein [Cryobacterium sp. TMT2-18-3]
MRNLAEDLWQAADAVALLGSSSADYEALPDAAVLAGQKKIAAARRLLDTRAALMAATIARRSRPELGHSGLAAQQGFLSPEALIQNWTGSSKGDAYKLVAVGTMMADTEAADKLVDATLSTLSTPDADAVEVAEFVARVPWQAPIARAVTAGTLSVDAAESIRAGLGQIDAPVTAEKLAAALAALLTEASTVNADEVFKRARRMRDRLDEAGIAAREKQTHDDRYLKIYRLGEEDAGRPPQHRPDRRGLSAAAAEDRRRGRPRPGLRWSRPSVRVIVTEKALTAVPGEETGTTEPAAHGQIEGNPVPISQETIDRLLCETGTRGIKFDAEAQIIDVGRDERLFTEAQRTAMGYVTADASGAAATGHRPGPRPTTSTSG